MDLSNESSILAARDFPHGDPAALTWQWSSDLAQYLKKSEFICQAIPYSAHPGPRQADEIVLPLHACCVVSAVQFGQVVSYTPRVISIEFRAQGLRQTSSIPSQDLHHYLRRNGFEMVAHLPSGLHRIVSVQAP